MEWMKEWTPNGNGRTSGTLSTTAELGKHNRPKCFKKSPPDQNIPNLADGSTTVHYFCPRLPKNAALLVTAANGAVVKSYPIHNTGEGQI